MRASLFLAIVFLLGSAGESCADKIGPPESYKQTSANEKFLFVMHTLKEAADAEPKGLRVTYRKSGLYKNDTSNDPLWTVDWYARSVLVASDGVHLVRFAGPHAYEQRLNEDRTKRVLTDADLKKEALSVFAEGKLVKGFTIGDFVDDVKALRKTVTFFAWSKQVKLIDEKGQLEVVTLDGNRVLVDLATGKVLEKKKAE